MVANVGQRDSLSTLSVRAPGRGVRGRSCRPVVATLALLAGAAGSLASPDLSRAEAKSKNPHRWAPRTRSVAVFKNGFGFFMAEDDVALRDGWCVAERIPPATFGTLAIYSKDEDRYVDVVGAGPGETVAFDDHDAPDDDATRRARLQAAEGLDIELTYRRAETEARAAGRLKAVTDEYAILESGAHVLAVPIADVTALQLLNMPLRVHVRGNDERDATEARLGLAYLRQGITWLPDYTLEIIDDETAYLTLRGTLINEAEDLIHADVHFVVGVPNFLHTDFMAPIAMGQVIRSIAAGVAPAAAMSQAVMNRAAIVGYGASSFGDGGTLSAIDYSPADAGGALAGLGSLPTLEGGPAGGDYAVYTKKDLTLRRGEKAIVTLMKQKIRYGHLYRWELPNPVKHCLLLENSTATAWTTGPCLALQGDSPLSEDLLRYTAPGSKAEFPVTTAINIAQDRSEVEVDRKLKAHSPAEKVHLDLVRLRGELRLKNFEDRPVELIVRAPVTGKPLTASDNGKVTVDTEQLKLLELRGTIHWRLTLAPNESKTLTYECDRYVPSY